MRRLLEELFRTYHNDVYRYLYSLSHDTSLSEDLASEVFLKVVKSIGTFRGEADIKTWLFSIARHEWYDYLRKKNRQIRTEAMTEFCESMDLGPEARYHTQEIIRRIYRLLEQEPERTRSIVMMRLDGYSFYEIGQKFGISESSARVIDFRTKDKLRKILKKEGFTHE
ncbi:MAG: RNA polymerase sigma factor [Lachnospiraceae bacterium]|nr:RNA polymerase sigma factor [Lachnospiraceae bacterium]